MSDYLKALLYPPSDITEQRALGFDASKNPTFRFKANLLGKLVGANMNVTTDNTIPIVGSAKYAITSIILSDASVSLTTAVGGIYTAASKGGTAVVAATQAYSAASAATKVVTLTLAAAGTADYFTGANLFLSLTTAQGAAATANIWVFGHSLD